MGRTSWFPSRWPLISRSWGGVRSRSAILAIAYLVALGCDSTTGPPKAFLLSVSEPYPGAGVIRSSPAGITCPVDCSEGYQKGQEIHLTGIPAPGWRMAGWSGACTLLTDTCTVRMAGAMLVSAIFVEAPMAPSDLSAEAVSRIQIDLTWKGESITEMEFRVEAWLSTGGGWDGWDEIAVVPANTTRYSHTGLRADTKYRYRLRACKGSSCSAYSATADATTFPFLMAPTGLVATAVSDSQIDVVWEARAPLGRHFEVERSSDGSGGWVQIARLPLGTIRYSDTGLLPGTTWYYRVRTCEESRCSAFSESHSATLPLRFLPPSHLVATPVTQARIDLTWMDNASLETRYEVERSPDGSAGWMKIAEAGNDASSLSDTTVLPGSSYYYRVRACEESSCTSYSKTDSATTAPGLSVLRGGWLHTCAISTGGNGYCWGYQLNGRLGDGSTEPVNQPSPAPVLGGLNFAAMASGTHHTCGFTAAGEAYCWGRGDSGQMGNGALSHQSEPVPVSGGLTFQSLGTGHSHSCGITGSGEAYCWGAGSLDQLGNGSAEDQPAPVAVAGTHTFVSVDAGDAHTCGLTATGDAYCWGLGEMGQLGDGSMTEQATPVPVVGGLKFQALTLGGHHTCGLTPAGDAYCWGRGEMGQLGNGSIVGQATPTPVSGQLTFESLSTGGFHTCGLIALGQAYCWGWNSAGQVAQESDRGNPMTPAPIIWH